MKIFYILNAKFEIVGSIQEGIRAMAWSPDQEVVILATGNDTIMAMSKDWEILFENSIETIPTKQLKSHIKQAPVANLVKAQPKIAWRADGKFFVVSSTDSDGKQWIRTWERSGAIFARNETTINGLGSCIHWRYKFKY